MLRELVGRNFRELSVYEKFSIRYLVIQLVEAASSVCLHILLNVFGERAEGFPECFARLSAKGVISRDLARGLSTAARLRSLLVHRYWTIDDERVYESVRRGLADFEEFVFGIRRYMYEGSDPEPVSENGSDFKYYELSPEEKARLMRSIGEELGFIDGIVFAYLHGGFLERPFFRDVDIAVWVSDPEKAFEYTVDLSASLETKLGFPVDLHVLNEAPLPFKYHVFARGKLLFSRDEWLRATVVDENMRKYLDLMEATSKLSTFNRRCI
ncbi:MAG: hypothetical protein B9J98_00945 [Candidatus Terraquivivens tikiterensis]|uniref:Polymerase beta nucleotidyltransferase domain-containing protein n=1 Tax=Candidatus Terraquivivens tikiterensis TaxID=1980982 RepID=A0A2R7Y9G9_9ARCH|nr:MAG: hypothetical protein B9J98_00945 [Candidatus Terraquivivens tikiterensis]